MADRMRAREMPTRRKTIVNAEVGYRSEETRISLPESPFLDPGILHINNQGRFTPPLRAWYLRALYRDHPSSSCRFAIFNTVS